MMSHRPFQRLKVGSMNCTLLTVLLMTVCAVLCMPTNMTSKRIQAEDEPLQTKVECPPAPDNVLRQLLGPAFNARYMSIEKPHDEKLPSDVTDDEDLLKDQTHTVKPKSEHHGDFVVDGQFERDLPNEHFYGDLYRHIAAYLNEAEARREKANEPSSADPDVAKEDKNEVSVTVPQKNDTTEQRRRRSTVAGGTPWGCDSRVVWHDLGPDRFPRYLRGVECTSSKCWFGHFKCKPKAFTVKVLRRKTDSCSEQEAQDLYSAPLEELTDVITAALPAIQRTWTFEERSVTFCCECVM